MPDAGVYNLYQKIPGNKEKGGGMRSEILHIYPHLSLTLISYPVLQNPTSFFFFYNTLRQCVGSASVLLCLL